MQFAEMVTITVDGVEVSVPKGTLVIRAAEAAGIAIPRFCDHPLLEPVGACRQCLVEITDAGNGRGFPKPQPSCTTEAAQGMVLATGATSAQAAKAQADILELLLINHPLDCPVCDKAGECPLQNQAMANGRASSDFDGAKRQYSKLVAISPTISLDRERCVLCTRCTRFADQIAGDPMIHLVERGPKQQIGVYPDRPYDSYFAGNVVQICPVGALTSNDYRFSARPFDLASTVTTCENCAAGCQLRVDTRRGEVLRRNAGDCPSINEEWSCDRGRFGFRSAMGEDRIRRPMIRKKGQLIEVSWPQALAAAAAGLKKAAGKTGVLTGGRLTLETAYAYSAFARTVLKTNSIDFRARPASEEEAQFLARMVAGQRFDEAISYTALEGAKKVVLIMLEPEEESPAIFLRLRKANRARKLVVETVAPFLSPGAAKIGASLIAVRPSDLPGAIRDLDIDSETIVLAGERLASVPGGFTALAARIEASSAKLAWVPRRAGEVGAVQAGCLPNLLPAGYPLTKTNAKTFKAHWGAKTASEPGLDAAGQLKAAAWGELKALVTAGIEAADFCDPELVNKALTEAFVVSLESRHSDVSEFANVILPVDVLAEVSGSFLNWENRRCAVNQVVSPARAAMSEVRVLAALATALGEDLGFDNSVDAGESFAAIPPWTGDKPKIVPVTPPPAKGSVMIMTGRELMDDSRCLDGAQALRAVERTPIVRMSPATLRAEGLATSTYVRLTGPLGSATFPLQVEPTMVDGVIWVPPRTPGNPLSALGLEADATVMLAAAPEPKKEGEE
jgi:NADH-quinone oxidoreductase subunit G